MRSKTIRFFEFLVILAMLLAPLNIRPALAVVGPTTDAPVAPVSQASPAFVKGVKGGISDTGLYIVQLTAASLAAYQGGVDNLAATSPDATGARRLDVNTSASQAYLQYLDAQQNAFIAQMDASLGRPVVVTFQYKNVLNGLAVQVSSDEAEKLAQMDGVRAVFADKNRQLDTDVGPEWIGAGSIWNGDTGSGVDTQGEGIIIGMIDSGINHEHPSFADVGGDGYDTTNPYGSGNYVGYCVSDPSFCNDKLIGAYDLYPGGSGGPEDTAGHGSHTSSTAGGNRHVAVFMVGTETITRTISGVAPHANIIAYKVCNPSCPESSSVMAVDHALADGVNVLNYSISGADDPWNDPVDLAFLDATAAGIFVAASAGNSGPGASTVAHTNPWNATVGASTHTRIFSNAFDVTDPAPVPPNLTGLAAVQGTGPVLPSDLSRPIAYDPADLNGCNPFSAGYFTGKLALIQRGSCTFLIKVTNAQDAGADGVIMFNNVGGPPIVMGGLEPTLIPSAMLTLDDGTAVMNWIDANPTTAAGTLYAAVQAVINTSLADVLAGFSSRGPSQFDVLKPDFVAPGVNILAAVQSQGGDPVQYDLYQGTSMASPHAAGSGALMIALHPDWSPVEIKSALASSAFNGPSVRMEDGVTPANPNADGSGRLALGDAATVGLVWDETYENFVAADPDTGGSPKMLNLSTMTTHNCVGTCTWTRTVSSVLDFEATYTATFTSTTGVVGSVTPSVFTLPAGGTQVLTVTADVTSLPIGTWVFGEVMLHTDASFDVSPYLPVADQHMTLSVLPAASNLPDLVTIATQHKSGSQMVNGLQVSQDITDLTVNVDGLDQAMVYNQNVPEDPTPGDPFNGDGGTFVTTMDVMTGTMRLVAQVMHSTSLDVDLFVGTGSTPSSGTIVCASATGAVLEYCNLDNPAPGTYWVLAQNYTGSPAPTDELTLAVGAVVPGDSGNLTVTGPMSVPAGDPFDLSVNWAEPSLMDGDVYYGVFGVGTDAGNPGNLGSVGVDFSYTQPVFLSKQGAAIAQMGDVISYTLTLTGTAGLNGAAWLTDTLPAGVEFAGGLTTTFGSASYDMGTNSVYWNDLPMPPAGRGTASQTPHPVALTLGAAPASGNIGSVAAPNDAVSLLLDDGSVEQAIGLNDAGVAYQFLWFNRFTPAPGDYPFALNQIDIYFSSNSNAMVGDPIDLVVYEDADGDPSNGAQWLKTYPVTIQAVPGLNSYDISSDPVILAGPGDVLIGAINRYTVSGVSPSSYPSAQDTTASQHRSWVAAYSADPPDPATLPPDSLYGVIDDFGPTLAGNWIIRGYGETVNLSPLDIQVTFNVTVTAETGTITNTADLTYNGDMFMASSVLNVVAPPTAMFTSNSPVMLGDTAVFTPTVTGTGPFDYMWDFGDGITSTMEAPTHTYMTADTFTVTLTVTSMYGMDTYMADFVVNPPEMMLINIYLPTVSRQP